MNWSRIDPRVRFAQHCFLPTWLSENVIRKRYPKTLSGAFRADLLQRGFLVTPIVLANCSCRRVCALQFVFISSYVSRILHNTARLFGADRSLLGGKQSWTCCRSCDGIGSILQRTYVGLCLLPDVCHRLRTNFKRRWLEICREFVICCGGGWFSVRFGRPTDILHRNSYS